MIDLDLLDKQCPKCSGLGRIGSPQLLKFWTKLDSNRPIGIEDQLTNFRTFIPEQPTEPMFSICSECHGRGKILTPEGKQLINFIRFWTNPNY